MNPADSFDSSRSSFHFLDLNEPLKQDHEEYGLIIDHAALPHQPALASSSACPTFFGVTQGYRSRTCYREYLQPQLKVDQVINVPVEGLYQPTDEENAKDHMKMADHEKRSASNNSRGSVKWMSSKLRVMRKVMPSYKSSETDLHIPAKSAYDNCFDLVKSADHWNSNSSTAEIVRVCSDCNTTKTPLWRGGPQGPKSLCNACGIRRRKARKAMALAASARNDSDKANKMQYCSSAESPKHHNVEKKLCTSCHDVTQFHRTTAKSKLSFEDFATTLISKKSTELLQRDEEEAAILLMALSSGLVHS